MKGLIIMSALFLLASCGAGKKEGNAQLTDMKVELEKLRTERDAIAEKMVKLEADILKMDPSSAAAENAKLVQVTPLVPKDFAHYIDLQGKITTENISFVSPRGMGGQVRAIYVKQGDRVKKGQLLLKLDDAVIQQQIASAKTQLSFAEDLYKRQQNLWKEGIGTEVYYPVPLHLQECYAFLNHRPGDFPASERASEEVLALPIYPELRDDQQDYVAERIKAFYKK